MSKQQANATKVPDLALLASGTQVTQAVPVIGRRLSLKLAWTGTPTGVFTLQSSFDGVNFDPVPGASAEFTANSNAQPAGSATFTVLNFINVPGSLWRLSYAATSGTGTLTTRFAQVA